MLLNSKARSAETALTGAARRFPFALTTFDGAACLRDLSGDGRAFFAGGSASLLSIGALPCDEATCSWC